MFVTAAYMVGAIGNILAYFLLNHVSQQTVRPWMLYSLRPDEFKACPIRSRSEINKRYSRSIDAGINCGIPRIEAEVEKRRQTGRILRSSLVPSLMIVLALLLNKGKELWMIFLLVLYKIISNS